MKFFVYLLIFFVSSALSHEQNFDVQGIKSYGGVFNDQQGQNQQHMGQGPLHVPVAYQPFGWSFNNQPQRTYGGVIRPNAQTSSANYGWAGAGNQFYYPGSSGVPQFPQFPFYQPQFPQFHFPNNFPYPIYPNNFPFPNFNNPHAGGHYPGGHQPGGHPHHPDHQMPQHPNHQAPHHPDHQIPLNPNHENHPDHQTPVHPSNSPQHPGNFYPDHQQPMNPNVDTFIPDNHPGIEDHHRATTQRPHTIPHPTQRPTVAPHPQPHPSTPGTTYLGPDHGPAQFPDSDSHSKPTYPSRIPATLPHPTTKKPNLDNDQENHPNSIDTGAIQYPTDAFFSKDKRPVNLDRNPWTDQDEQAWQATTKKPYFENRIPILECTMPAAAILGASTAMGVSNLMPLRIPIGKPILSCNATEIAQVKINLDGTIYDCRDGQITKSCPRADRNNQIIDACAGETLQCDVAARNNWRSASCTNGTMISNHHIICTSFTLMRSNNALNCIYDSGRVPATPRPSFNDKTSVIPLAPVTENTVEDLDNRGSYGNEQNELDDQVKVAMSSVFPHELLMSSDLRKMSMPGESLGNPQFPDDVKTQLNGVFPHNLFALSQQKENTDDDYGDVRTYTRFGSDEGIQTSQQQRNQWIYNRGSGNPTGQTKTKNNQLHSRLGSDSEPTADDRHVFSQ